MMMSDREMLTLVIPTKNRSRFLARLLNYYAQLGLEYPVLIADSSDPGEFGQIGRIIRNLSDRLDVTHLSFPPDLSAFRALAKSFERVQTPYAVFASDDDFYVPEALRESVRFLEHHPDVSVAHGLFVMFGLYSGSTHGRIQWVTHYDCRDIGDGTGRGRLENFLRDCYAPGNSVHRTADIRDAYDRAVRFNLGPRFAELFTSCLPIIRGKVKRVDRLYKICQAHSNQASSSRSVDPMDWISDPAWNQEYVNFRNGLSDELARTDGIAIEEGREILKKAFWRFFADDLVREWNVVYSPRYFRNLRVRLNTAARRVLGRLKTRHRAFSFIPVHAIDISLPDLLSTSSPYRSDFLPVYRAIISPPVEEA